MKTGWIVFLVILLALVIFVILAGSVYFVGYRQAPKRFPPPPRAKPIPNRLPWRPLTARSVATTRPVATARSVATARPAEQGKRRALVLDGTELSELDICKGENVDDLCAFTHNREEYTLFTTGAKRALLRHEKGASLVRNLSHPVTDIARHGNQLFFLGTDKQVYSSSILDMVTSENVTLDAVRTLAGVISIESPGDHSCVYALQETRGLVYADGSIRHETAPVSMGFGDNFETTVAATPRGLKVMPNDETIEEVDLAVLLPDGKLFGVNTAMNPWIGRIRVLGDAPVFFTRDGGGPLPVLIH